MGKRIWEVTFDRGAYPDSVIVIAPNARDAMQKALWAAKTKWVESVNCNLHDIVSVVELAEED